ncbi:putative O-glycosylation ligase, exosortase A system-associated [Beggiatoa alba]|nr:putative O-glycosylation ligase, exosortase A system-associated [Beggiatoa alba]
MRDLVLLAFFAVCVYYILKRPYIGVLVWSLFGYLNPHKSTFGFAYNFPFAQITGLLTITALLFSKEPKKLPITPLVILYFIYLSWMTLTTVFSFNPEEAWFVWEKVMKIQAMTILTLILINSREKIEWLVLTIVVSIGFYGVKGGIFTIFGGGYDKVRGPTSTFIEGNTEIGLALIMVLPLIRYLNLQAKNPWISRMFLAAVALTAVAILGTQSRGALLGLVAIGFFLWLKSRQKIVLTVLFVLFIPIMINFMPQTWFDKMNTIETYEEDGSAMGRIQAWRFAISLANSHPILGGGYETFDRVTWTIYTPDPGSTSRAAHSIYFQVLGEHGYVGLLMFLGILGGCWRTASSIIRNVKKRDDLKWASDLAAMLQVSLIGYAVAGAFLSLANFDLFYHVFAIIVVLKVVVDKAIKEPPSNIGSQEKITVEQKYSA